jgi:hypothetical protein
MTIPVFGAMPAVGGAASPGRCKMSTLLLLQNVDLR